MNISISNALNVWSNGSIIKSKLINTLLNDYLVDNILDDTNIFNNLNELKPGLINICLLYTSPSPRDGLLSRMPSSA